MDGYDKNDGQENHDRQEIFSQAVRAGKRTYFFDVKATRRNDYYLTITESKKRFNKDGRYYFEKHKVFLYKEDFDKFAEGLEAAVEFIKNANPQLIEENEHVSETEELVEAGTEDYTKVEFEDLSES